MKLEIKKGFSKVKIKFGTILGTIKIKWAKIKIKEKFTNLKNDVKAKPLKYIIILVISYIFIYPLRSFADPKLEEQGKKVRLPKKPIGEMVKDFTIGAAITIAIAEAIYDLRKVFDPKVPSFAKPLYATKSCCIVSAVTSGFVMKKTEPLSKVHKVATACCLVSVSGYLNVAQALESRLADLPYLSPEDLQNLPNISLEDLQEALKSMEVLLKDLENQIKINS